MKNCAKFNYNRERLPDNVLATRGLRNFQQISTNQLGTHILIFLNSFEIFSLFLSNIEGKYNEAFRINIV